MDGFDVLKLKAQCALLFGLGGALMLLVMALGWMADLRFYLA